MSTSDDTADNNTDSLLSKAIKKKEALLDNLKARGAQDRMGRDRLPPGQHLEQGFPVLDLGIQPRFDAERWRFKVKGMVENPMDIGWEEFKALPSAEQVSDFHCVTTWSKYDVRWRGVKFSTICDMVRPHASVSHVIQECNDGYTTNLPIAHMLGSDILLAYELEGDPLAVEHGGPMRMLVPHLYAWKSSKFLIALAFQDHDTPGFWEIRGYHDLGDPWKEQRFR